MIGERIRLAREATLATQKDLAAATAVPQSYISDIENGRVAEPAAEIIERIAEALLYPVGFFYCGPLPNLPDGYYRRLKRGTSKEAKRVRAQVRQVLELVERAESQLKLPPVNLAVADDLADLNAIEQVTTLVRMELGVSGAEPIPNVTRAAERAGVVVVGLAGTLDGHDGFSAWPNYGLDGRPVIALSRGNPGDRDRLTVAHELGHLTLHTHRKVDAARAEQEAFRFAGALLLPAEPARAALRAPVTLTVLKNVKATFGISMAAAARRAFDLQLVSKDHFTSLMKQLSARGWRKREPGEIPPEEPLLIAKIIDQLGGEGSLKARSERLHIPAFQLRTLTAA